MVSNAYFFPASRGSFSGIIAHFMIDSDSRSVRTTEATPVLFHEIFSLK